MIVTTPVIKPIIPSIPDDEKLLYFFKKVNTDYVWRDYFFAYPVELLYAMGIEISEKHHNELRNLIKKFNAHPPQGAKSVIYPASDMYEMILLLNDGKTPTGSDDLLIT
jgi:hypothetical protein